MGLEYRVSQPSSLQQKALRDLHKSFYVFATVIAFFAVLGFLFIVWYYGALVWSSNNHNNNDGSASEVVNGTTSVRNAFLRGNPVSFSYSPFSTNPEAMGTFLQQEGGIAGIFENTHSAVWIFSVAHINKSDPTGAFSTVKTHNLVVLVDASSDNAVQTSYYTDLLMGDIHVTSVVGIGANVYLFYYSKQHSAYGIGKLFFNNDNTLTFSIVNNNIVLPGPVIMGTTTNTHVLLYFQQATQEQVLLLPRYVFEVMVHNGQLWASFKLDLLDKPALLNITSLDPTYVYPLTLDGDDGTNILYSVEWNEYMGQYVMLSAHENQVHVWHSSTPYGPFTINTSLAFTQTVSKRVTHTYFHKEMWRGAGRIMVFTYCTDGNSGSLAHLAEIECCNIEKPV